jgi:hypothetical protein
MIFLTDNIRPCLYVTDLFYTFPVVLVGYLLKKTKTLFLALVWVFAERPVDSFCIIFTFTSWTCLLWRWFNSSNHKGNILKHHKKFLKNHTFFRGGAFYGRYCSWNIDSELKALTAESINFQILPDAPRIDHGELDIVFPAHSLALWY